MTAFPLTVPERYARISGEDVAIQINEGPPLLFVVVHAFEVHPLLGAVRTGELLAKAISEARKEDGLDADFILGCKGSSSKAAVFVFKLLEEEISHGEG